MRVKDHRELIVKVARVNGVAPELVEELLALEPQHANLHAWGARPALRRCLAEIIDNALKASAENTGG
jgi:hypothetical protein